MNQPAAHSTKNSIKVNTRHEDRGRTASPSTSLQTEPRPVGRDETKAGMEQRAMTESLG